MIVGEDGHRSRPRAAEDLAYYRQEQEEPENLTPVRRAALEALEREFRDLLAPAR